MIFRGGEQELEFVDGVGVGAAAVGGGVGAVVAGTLCAQDSGSDGGTDGELNTGDDGEIEQALGEIYEFLVLSPTFEGVWSDRDAIEEVQAEGGHEALDEDCVFESSIPL